MWARANVDVALERGVGIGAETALDWSGLDEGDVDAAAGELQAQRVGETLEGELARVVGAPVFHRDESEHRAVLHDPPVTLPAHHRKHSAGELVPAEEVRLELLAQHVGAQVLDRTRLTVRAVVDERVESPLRPLQRRFHPRADRLAVVEVEPQRLETEAREPLDIGLLACRGEHPVAACPQTQRDALADAARAARDQHRTLLPHGRAQEASSP